MSIKGNLWFQLLPIHLRSSSPETILQTLIIFRYTLIIITGVNGIRPFIKRECNYCHFRTGEHIDLELLTYNLTPSKHFCMYFHRSIYFFMGWWHITWHPLIFSVCIYIEAFNFFFRVSISFYMVICYFQEQTFTRLFLKSISMFWNQALRRSNGEKMFLFPVSDNI